MQVDRHLRDPLIKALAEKGIQSKAYFSPCIHLQEFYKTDLGYREGMFPVAERLSKETIILPFFTEITEEQILYVRDTVKDILSTLLKTNA